MFEAIKNFANQFAYEPKIENIDALKSADKFLVIGMGGSHLAADLLKVWDPSFDIIIHQDYKLPSLPEGVLKDRLIILSSYSGNTEETLSAFEEADAKNLPLAIISIGGKLLELAKKNKLPYVQMPNTGIQPRSAIGFNLMALLRIMNLERAITEARQISSILKPLQFEVEGRELAKRLNNFVPIIYSSLRNFPIAYNWKIKFIETSKIPAFYNVFPELNHNEMAGFDANNDTEILSKNFYFLLLEDKNDTPKIKKRMKTLAKLYRDHNLKIEFIKLVDSNNIFYKIFSSLILSDWTAYYIAKSYGVESEQVPMVEEFKKLI